LFELAGGIDLILNPRSAGAAGIVSNVLVALLIIGVARAWELVGDRDTSIIASIAVLTGHDHNPDGSLPASALPEPTHTTGAGDPGPLTLIGQTTARSELHFASERIQLVAVVKERFTRTCPAQYLWCLIRFARG
jgi:hypothetical protein